MKAYLSSLYDTIFERDYNISLSEKIAALGYEVFLPQKNKENKSDLAAIKEADVFILVYDGRELQESQGFELGAAKAYQDCGGKKKIIIGINASLAKRGNDSFVRNSLNYMADSEILLIDYLKTYLLRSQNI